MPRITFPMILALILSLSSGLAAPAEDRQC